jgi:hypothetical protein
MKRVLCFIVSVVFIIASYSQDVGSIINEVSLDSLVKTVREITGEDYTTVNGTQVLIRNRQSANPGNEVAKDYIKERFLKRGLAVQDQAFSSNGHNVIATQTGINLPDSIYIISCHYDAMADYCADDNGSGIAAVMEAARILSKYCFDYTILYIAFDQEEQGQIGSSYCANQAYSNGYKIAGVLNMDMIAYDSNDDRKFEIHTNSFTSSLALKNALVNTINNYSLSLDPVVVNPGATGSDHGPFWTRGYGAVCVSELFFHGDANPYYHTSSDRISRFNLNYFNELTKMNIGTLATISKLNPTCQQGNETLSVSPDNQNVTAAAGSTTFTISSNTSWTITDNATWLTVNPTSGSNDGTITATYTANSSTTARTATITVSGTGVSDQQVTVTQSGIATLSVTPANRDVTAAAGSTTFSITSNSSWTVTDNATWLTVNPTSGNNNGTITATYTANTSGTARTATITVSGTGASDQQVTVTQSGIVTLSVTPSNRDVGAETGSTTFTISSNTSWTITDNATWLTVNPTSGSGDGTITATYTANSSTTARTATITVSGTGASDQQVTVTQSGIPTLSVTPSNRDVEADAGSTTFTISSNTSWTVTDNAAWLTVNPTSGSGDGTITATYSANTLASARTAIITISGTGVSDQQVTVKQNGTITLSVTPSNRNVGAESGSTTFAISSNASWTVSDDATWLIINPTTGSGNGTLTATYTSNTSPSARIATITISAGGANSQQVTVTQSGITTLSVTPSNRDVAAEEGSTTFIISSNTSWTVTDDADWLIINPTTGNGNGTITASYTANGSASARIATITVSGTGATSQQVTVTQNGIITLSATPSNRDVTPDAGSTTFTISSNTSWTIYDDADWLTINPSSGSGNGTITANYSANTSTSTRIATITISGTGVNSQQVTVTQSGITTLSVTPASRNVAAEAGSTTFTITSNTSWTITDDADWLTINPSSGSGNGTITATYTANTSSSERTATITISGTGVSSQQVTVVQSGITMLTVTPSSRDVAADAGSTTFTITSNTSWAITDDADWLTITPSGGSGDATITATYTANASSIERIATVTVSGTGASSQQVTVVQSGMTILSVTPSNRDVGSQAGSTTFIINSNTSWTIADDAGWLSINPTSGSGDVTITATYSANTSAIARIATITVSGTGVSSQQVTVTQSGIITLSVTPSNRDVEADAGSTTFTISSNTSWTITDNVGWLSINPTSGSGNNTITATYATNTSFVARIATITVSGAGVSSQQVTVTQSGIIMLSVLPSNRDVAADAGSTTFNVISNTSWSITDDADWLTINPTGGSGSSAITATYTANTTSIARTATITVSGTGVSSRQVTVTQSAAAILSVAPSNRNVGSDAGSTTFNITSSISWTAVDDADWLTINPASGSGDATITANFEANASATVRTAAITISGVGTSDQQVTVTQSGSTLLSVTPANRDVGSAAGSTTFTISSNTTWDISDDADWLTTNLPDGSGNATISATFTENTSAEERIATIMISGAGVSTQQVTVTQSGIITLSVIPSNRDVVSDAGSTTFTISSNTSWTISDNAAWLTVSPTSGSGNGTITATYAANTSSSSRSATITVSGTGTVSQQVTVTQGGLTALSVTPTNRDVTSAGGSVTFDISSNTSWVVSDDAPWLTISPASGIGNGTITASYSANTSPSARISSITISGDGVASQQVTVTQSGIITLSAIPSNRDVVSAAGSTTFTISSNTSWTITDNASWLTINPASGSGNRTITATYTSNTSSATRTATITISGSGASSQQVTVTQLGINSLSATPSNRDVGATAGSATFTINSNTSWTITDDASWLSINPAAGSGNGTITATYTANSSAIARTATITISGTGVSSQQVTVTQNGIIIMSVTPSNRPVGAEAGSTKFTVTSNTSWTFTDDASWLSLNPSTGSGDGIITATYATNTSAASRTATITASGTGAGTQQVTVTQGSTTILSVAPSGRDIGAETGSVTFTITSNISWTVTDDAEWLTINPASGSGNATITATYEANTTAAARIAAITVSGAGVNSQQVAVVQTGMNSLSVVPVNRNVGPEPGSVIFTVSSNSDWTISDDADWLTVDPLSGNCNGMITAVFTANISTSVRTATVTVSGPGSVAQQVTVTQNGINSLTVTPYNRNAGAEAGSTTFTISSNTIWTIACDADWVALDPSAGNDDGTLSATFKANITALMRIATITISGAGISSQQVTITQYGINSGWELKQNYPNPFTNLTTIEFFVPEPSRVEINVFNINGVILDVLLGETFDIGWHSIEWTPPDYYKNGIYFYQLRTDKPQAIRKMIYLGH